MSTPAARQPVKSSRSTTIAIIGIVILTIMLGISIYKLVEPSAAEVRQAAEEQEREQQEARELLKEELGLALTDEQEADDFVHAGGGVGVRFATDEEKEETSCPSYSESCFYVTVVTNAGCSRGIYIELSLRSDTGTVIGKTNEITPAMSPGDKGVFAIGTTQSAPRARLASVSCMG